MAVVTLTMTACTSTTISLSSSSTCGKPREAPVFDNIITQDSVVQLVKLNARLNFHNSADCGCNQAHSIRCSGPVCLAFHQDSKTKLDLPTKPSKRCSSGAFFHPLKVDELLSLLSRQGASQMALGLTRRNDTYSREMPEPSLSRRAPQRSAAACECPPELLWLTSAASRHAWSVFRLSAPCCLAFIGVLCQSDGSGVETPRHPSGLPLKTQRSTPVRQARHRDSGLLSMRQREKVS